MRTSAVLRWERVVATLAAFVLAVTGAVVAAGPASAASGSVSGSVTLPEGTDARALEALEINLWNDESDLYASPDTVTGEFAFEDVAPGDYVLAVWIYDYYDPGTDTWIHPNLVQYMTDVTVPDGGLSGLDIMLEQGYSITGTIDLPTGIDPAAYQALNLYAYGENEGSGWGWVDPETGEYRIDGLVEDDYIVELSVDSYWNEFDALVYPNLISEYYDNAYSWEDATLVGVWGDDASGIDFSLEKGSTITGTISLAPGASLQPGEGFEVYAASIDGMRSRGGSVNPVTGAYSITGLTPGQYVVQAAGSGVWDEENEIWSPSLLAAEFYNNAYTFNQAMPVAVNGTKSGVNIQLALGKSISGTVTAAGDAPADWWRGVEVSVQTPGEENEWLGSVEIGESGAYTITGLPPIGVIVSFDAYGYWDGETETYHEAAVTGEYYDDVRWFEDATVLDLATGNRTGIDAELAAAISISGTVTLAPGADPSLWDEGITVYAESEESGNAGWVDPLTGEYSIGGLRPGEYTVSFQGDGLYDEETGNWTPSRLIREYWDDQTAWWEADMVDATAGSVTGIDAELAEGSTISGMITVPDGTDPRWPEAIYVSAASVNTDESYYGLTLGDGSYMLPGLPDGDYIIEFWAGSYWDEELGEEVEVGLQGEYYDDAEYFDDATPVTVTGADVSGIDAELGAAAPVITLTDIATNPFKDEIEWLAATGVTRGWDNGDGTASFRPLVNVNRDVMAAFLYRMAGSDYEGPAVSPFVDVPTTHVFYDEIAWLAEEGISTGWVRKDGKKEFRPGISVNRDVMAAFLYRFAGSPDYTAPAVSPFKDVPTTHVFYDEIAWLAEEGISQGWAVSGGKEFRPTLPVKRDVMAAFLYRFTFRAV